MTDADTNNTPVAEKRVWTQEMKAQIVAEAETAGPAATMKKYNVASPQFYTWRKALSAGANVNQTAAGTESQPQRLVMKRPSVQQLGKPKTAVQRPVAGYDHEVKANRRSVQKPTPMMDSAVNEVLAKGKIEVNHMQTTVGQLYLENIALKQEVEQLRNEVHAAHAFRD